MRKFVLVILMFVVLANVMPSYGLVDGITRDNYLEYEKPIKDRYGFNKGECVGPYLEGEEWFYNECYDHYNVDLVYDRDIIPKEYLNPGIKVVEDTTKATPKKAKVKTKKVAKKSKAKKSKLVYKNKLSK